MWGAYLAFLQVSRQAQTSECTCAKSQNRHIKAGMVLTAGQVLLQAPTQLLNPHHNTRREVPLSALLPS